MAIRVCIQYVMYHIIIDYCLVVLLWLSVDKATRSRSVNFFRMLQTSDDYIEDDISRKRQDIISLFLKANYKQRGKCIFLYMFGSYSL